MFLDKHNGIVADLLRGTQNGLRFVHAIRWSSITRRYFVESLFEPSNVPVPDCIGSDIPDDHAKFCGNGSEEEYSYWIYRHHLEKY